MTFDQTKKSGVWSKLQNGISRDNNFVNKTIVVRSNFTGGSGELLPRSH